MSLNAVAETLTGWNTSEAGASRWSRYSGSSIRIPGKLWKIRVQVLRTGKIVGLANHTLLIAKDGTERPIDDTRAPILDDVGQFRGVVVVFRDVTQKSRSRDGIAPQRERAGRLFRKRRDPVARCRAGRHHPPCQPGRARHARLQPRRVRRPARVRVHVDRQAIDNILARLSRGEVMHNYEARLRCKDGSIKDVLVTSSVTGKTASSSRRAASPATSPIASRPKRRWPSSPEPAAMLAALSIAKVRSSKRPELPVPFLADWCVVYVVDEHGEIDYHAHAHRDPTRKNCWPKCWPITRSIGIRTRRRCSH